MCLSGFCGSLVGLSLCLSGFCGSLVVLSLCLSGFCGSLIVLSLCLSGFCGRLVVLSLCLSGFCGSLISFSLCLSGFCGSLVGLSGLLRLKSCIGFLGIIERRCILNKCFLLRSQSIISGSCCLDCSLACVIQCNITDFFNLILNSSNLQVGISILSRYECIVIGHKILLVACQRIIISSCSINQRFARIGQGNFTDSSDCCDDRIGSGMVSHSCLRIGQLDQGSRRNKSLLCVGQSIVSSSCSTYSLCISRCDLSRQCVDRSGHCICCGVVDRIDRSFVIGQLGKRIGCYQRLLGVSEGIVSLSCLCDRIRVIQRHIGFGGKCIQDRGHCICGILTNDYQCSLISLQLGNVLSGDKCLLCSGECIIGSSCRCDGILILGCDVLSCGERLDSRVHGCCGCCTGSIEGSLVSDQLVQRLLRHILFQLIGQSIVGSSCRGDSCFVRCRDISGCGECIDQTAGIGDSKCRILILHRFVGRIYVIEVSAVRDNCVESCIDAASVVGQFDIKGITGIIFIRDRTADIFNGQLGFRLACRLVVENHAGCKDIQVAFCRSLCVESDLVRALGDGGADERSADLCGVLELHNAPRQFDGAVVFAHTDNLDDVVAGIQCVDDVDGVIRAQRERLAAVLVLDNKAVCIADCQTVGTGYACILVGNNLHGVLGERCGRYDIPFCHSRAIVIALTKDQYLVGAECRLGERAADLIVSIHGECASLLCDAVDCDCLCGAVIVHLIGGQVDMNILVGDVLLLHGECGVAFDYNIIVLETGDTLELAGRLNIGSIV